MKNIHIIVFFCLCGIAGHAQWDVIHYGGENTSEVDMFFHNQDTGYVIGFKSPGSFILKTVDGGMNWDSLWYEPYQFRDIYFPSLDTGYIACFHNNHIGVMRSIDAGVSWELIASDLISGMSVPLGICFFDNHTGVITASGWAAKTTDSGITWDFLENYPIGGQPSTQYNNDVYMSAGGSVIHYSTDQLNSFNSDTLANSGSHFDLELKGFEFLKSSLGSGGYDLGYNSYNFGIIVTGNLQTSEYHIKHFPDRNRMWGVSWPSQDIMYAISPSLYIGDDFPHFFIKSIDGGQTWYEQESLEYGYPGTKWIDCPNESVCYAIGGDNSKIYKTTNGGGPLLNPVTQISVSASSIEEEPAFSIFPNPTTGQIQISSENEPIKRIEIFDLQGKKLFETFPNGFNHQLRLESFPAGMYIVQIWASDKILTGKVVKE